MSVPGGSVPIIQKNALTHFDSVPIPVLSAYERAASVHKSPNTQEGPDLAGGVWNPTTGSWKKYEESWINIRRLRFNKKDPKVMTNPRQK